MNPSVHRNTALILAGGVAKGAFEAGALSVLATRGLHVSQVVGASSGSLNATMYAASIRANREAVAAQRLVSLWREEADWMHVFHFSLKNLVERRALSDSTRIMQLLRTEVPQIATAAVNDVGLRLVVGAVNGTQGDIGGQPATTFEGVVSFEGSDFDDEHRREAIYTAAAASAAFPVVFAPVEVAGLGPCYDGGVVNDTPVRLATEAGAQRVIVIAPYPAVMTVGQAPSGIDLVMHLVDILIHERLYRDLHDAARLNAVIAKLGALVETNVLSAEQMKQVLTILAADKIEVITIRPATDLPGNTFDGFRDRGLREQYVVAGQQAAERALANVMP
jgi:NTE family protein